jgi:hypothetical protein
MAAFKQTLNGFPVMIEAGRLHVWTFVPTKAQPCHGIENTLRHFVARTLSVGVFDAKDENAFVFASEEPIEEGSPCPSNVKVSGR